MHCHLSDSCTALGLFDSFGVFQKFVEGFFDVFYVFFKFGKVSLGFNFVFVVWVSFQVSLGFLWFFRRISSKFHTGSHHRVAAHAVTPHYPL